MDDVTTVAFFLPFAVAAILFLLLLEQLAYIRKKGPLPGPPLVVPFLGCAAAISRKSAAFWEDQAALAGASGLSANYTLGRFTVFITDASLSHQVLANVRQDAFHLVMNPFGKRTVSDSNITRLYGQQHRDMQRRMLRTFAARPLAAYLAVQHRVITKHLRMWLDAAPARQPVKMRQLISDMNIEFSTDTIIGRYLPDEARRHLRQEPGIFTVILKALPVDLPGFAYHRTWRVVAQLEQAIVAAVRESRARMLAGEEPSCLLDFWMHDQEAAAGATDEEIGENVFGLLFGAQAGTITSVLSWSVALLAAHPGVLERVRSEVSDSDAPLFTLDGISSLRYTNAVAKEVLRFRPPARIVSTIAGEAYPLQEGYTIPKGSLVFVSLHESSFQGFPDADRFDPDRFLEPRNEDKEFKKYFLTFGAGAHQCVAQRYTLNVAVLFIAMFVSACDFERHRTEGCDEFIIDPALYPKDDCTVFLRRRPGTPEYFG